MSGLQHRRTTHDLFAPKGAQPYGAAASASAPPPTAPPPAPVAARAIQPKTVGQPYVEAEVVRESALYEYFWLWCCGIFFVLVFFGFFFWLGVEAAENNHGFCNGNNHGSHDGHGDMCHCESFGGHQHCGLVAEFVASRMNLKKKVRDSGWFESSLWQEDIYLHQPKLQLASVNHYVDQIAHDTSLINAPEGVTVERVSAEYRPLFRRAAMAAFDKIGVHNATGATVHTVHTWVYQKSQKWRVLASVAPEATQNWISFTVMREKGGAFVLDNVDTMIRYVDTGVKPSDADREASREHLKSRIQRLVPKTVLPPAEDANETTDAVASVPSREFVRDTRDNLPMKHHARNPLQPSRVQ